MKKIYFLAALTLGLLTINNAQEVVVGGDMESADDWTIVDLAPGDGHTETFGYTMDAPADGEDGCLSLAGEGNWSNVAVCQEITVSRGYPYRVSMVVKTSMDFQPESNWVEIVVIPSMPAVDADITAYPNVFTLNSWECSDVLFVDGDFATNNCDAKSTLNDIINIDGVGDTTVVLVLKAGGGGPYNVLLDNVSVMEEGGTSVQTAANAQVHVFPSPFETELTISLDRKMQEVTVLNLLGQSVYNQKNIHSASHKVNLSGHATGIYYVIVTDMSGNQSTAKTIKY